MGLYGSAVGRHDDSLERPKQQAKQGIFQRKIVKTFRGVSRRGPRLVFAPLSVTRLLNSLDGLIVGE
jgi:hypothetical protein